MPNYSPSTRARIADLIMGMHANTTHGGLVAANFTSTAQTELFNITGRIGIMQLFIELTSAADVNATVVMFNATFTTPTIALNALCIDCTSIASLVAHQRITCVGDAVGTALSLTDGPGVTDVTMAGNMILGGETAAGANTVGSIGMLASTATQAATISATAHLFYIPLSVGAFAVANV